MFFLINKFVQDEKQFNLYLIFLSIESNYLLVFNWFDECLKVVFFDLDLWYKKLVVIIYKNYIKDVFICLGKEMENIFLYYSFKRFKYLK